MEELNKILHQPIRIQIMAYLVVHDTCDYSTLKQLFDLSDGHMTTHMRELLGSEYVRAEKSIVNGKSKTVYVITELGKQMFMEYIATFKRIISATKEL